MDATNSSRRDYIRMERLSTRDISQSLLKDDVPLAFSADDARMERRVKLKLDFFILPLLVSVQFLSQMAKSDLGNAQVAGMQDELNLSSADYSNVAAMLLVGSILFQLPGTLLLRKIGPPFQFGGAMILWGLFTTCLISVNSVEPLMALRLLTGAAEALIQGTLLYLSYWYKYNELATRGAFFTATAALAGAFNGVIAGAIETNLGGHNGWLAWRWIFLIEGVVPMIWGFFVMLLLPNTPETVRRIFSPTEREIVIRRSRAAHNTGESKLRPKAMLEVLLDPTFWMLAAMNCCVDFTESSLPNFLPSILQGIGWEGEQAQLMSSIVYVCAFVSIMTWAKIADKTGKRGLPIAINCCVAILGFVLLRFLTGPTGRLIAVCLVAVGAYPCVLLVIVWLALLLPGYSYRSSAVAFIFMASRLFGILGNEVYVDPPLYHTGMAVSASLLAVAGVMAVALMWRLKLLNRRKVEMRGTDEARALSTKSIDELGNKHPEFMYSF